MPLQQLDDLEAHRMMAEIGGDIGQPDAIMVVARAVPQGWRRLRHRHAHHAARTFQQQGIVLAIADQGPGIETRFAPLHARRQLRFYLCHARPVAFIQRRQRDLAEHLGIIRRDGQDAVILGHRFAEAVHLRQGRTAVHSEGGIVWRQRYCALEAGQCQCRLAHQQKRVALVVQGVGMGGLQFQRAVEAGIGLLGPHQLQQQAALVEPGAGIVRRNRQRRVEAGQRGLEPLQHPQRVAAIVERVGKTRLQLQRCIIFRNGFVGTLQLLQGVAHVQQHRDIVGSRLVRHLQKGHRLGAATLLDAQRAQQIAHLRMTRHGGQQLAVE